MKQLAVRVLTGGVATAFTMVAVAGVAAAGPNALRPVRVLNVIAVSVGGTTYAAVTNAIPGHVCRAWPDWGYVGPTDEFGQVIVGPVGTAAVIQPGAPHTSDVVFTCGPRGSEFTRTGSAPVFVGS